MQDEPDLPNQIDLMLDDAVEKQICEITYYQLEITL